MDFLSPDEDFKLNKGKISEEEEIKNTIVTNQENSSIKNNKN
jgi:hypothetical protein